MSDEPTTPPSPEAGTDPTKRVGPQSCGDVSAPAEETGPDLADEQLFQLVRRPVLALLTPAGEVLVTQNPEGFQELLAGIQGRSAVAGKFTMPGEDISLLENLIQPEVHEFLRHTAAEVARIDEPDEREALLRRLFARQEKYLLAEKPQVDLIVPVLGATFESTAAFGDYETIEMTPALIRRFLDGVETSSSDKAKLVDATHALRLRGIDCVPGGYADRFVASVGELAHEVIERFFEGAAVVGPGYLTYGQLGLFPLDWSTNLVDPTRPFVYLVRDYGVRLDALRRENETISTTTLVEMDAFIKALSTAHSSIKVAARRLTRSWARSSDEDRIIDLSIGLEAILGSGFSETVHRISLRAAALLTLAGRGRSKSTYDAMKGMYSYRSRVVHGTPGPHKQDLLKIDGVPIHASRFAMAALRELLRLAVTIPGFHPDKIDEMFIYTAFDKEAGTLRRGAAGSPTGAPDA